MSLTDALQLNKTEMFSKIRDGLSPCQQTQNLIECKDDLIFAWESKQSCVLVLNWRAAQLKETNYQTLIPSSSQNFEVERLVISNEGTLLCLAGPRGAALLELPRRWGKEGQFMEGKPKITCRTYCLDALLFVNNPHLEIRQIRWHPGSTTDSHLLVLLSDNTIRMYNNGQLRHVWQVGPLPIKGKQSNMNSSFGVLGEIAVDFDIGPAVKTKNTSVRIEQDVLRTSLNHSKLNQTVVVSGSKPSEVEKIEWPLVLLRENGNIYIIMTGFDTEKARLQGPITITPSAVDNYGLDSCAILVIPSLPPTLVIAESNGKLHHALLLEAETTENSFNDVDADIDIKPSEWTIHVLETVELELGLPKTLEGVAASKYTCPIFLKRDYINEFRYFAYHNTGLHVVSLNFIGELQRFLESEATDDMVSLATPSSAEYLVCTKIDKSDRVNSVLGFVLLQMPSSLVLLLSSGQVISLKVIIDAKLLEAPVPLSLHTSAANDNYTSQLVAGPSFVEHIRNMLQRSLTQPILSADKSSTHSPNECYELLNQSMEVLRAHYLKRHDMVRAEFAKRINCIRLQKEQQLREIENLERDREVISEQAHKLAERFEEISDYQEILIKKCHDLMRKANIALPGNIAAEREFSQEVAAVNKSTKLMAAQFQIAKKSIKKQSYHINKSNESAKRITFELPEKQHRTIIEILAQTATEIDRQIKDVKRINKVIGI